MTERTIGCNTWMEWLGEFSPTVDKRTVKGYRIGPDGEAGKSYLDSNDLRHLAAACTEMADWLDAAKATSNTSSEQQSK